MYEATVWEKVYSSISNTHGLPKGKKRRTWLNLGSGLRFGLIANIDKKLGRPKGKKWGGRLG